MAKKASNPGLYANIQAKRERIASGSGQPVEISGLSVAGGVQGRDQWAICSANTGATLGSAAGQTRAEALTCPGKQAEKPG